LECGSLLPLLLWTEFLPKCSRSGAASTVKTAASRRTPKCHPTSTLSFRPKCRAFCGTERKDPLFPSTFIQKSLSCCCTAESYSQCASEPRARARPSPGPAPSPPDPPAHRDGKCASRPAR